jgi:hypothetical protein
MRPHGRARINARYPQALGICDRCGFMYNLSDLQWQWDWLQGPRLFNLRILVCPPCLDEPQENGRTIVLPPDPIPVANARPENYVNADNPQSYLGFSPATNSAPVPPQTVAMNIGNLTQGFGVNAAFDGNAEKRAPYCAGLAVSLNSSQNWVGKNWNQDVSGFSLIHPSTVATQTMTISSFTITAPIDAPFLRSGATSYTLDGSADGQTWATLSSGTTAGTVAESITVTTTSATPYQYHRIALTGNGVSAVAIAQAVFNVSNAAPNDI